MKKILIILAILYAGFLVCEMAFEDTIEFTMPDSLEYLLADEFELLNLTPFQSEMTGINIRIDNELKQIIEVFLMQPSDVKHDICITLNQEEKCFTFDEFAEKLGFSKDIWEEE